MNRNRLLFVFACWIAIFHSANSSLAQIEQLAKLTAADAAAGDYFGNAVDISGDFAVVGAWLGDDGGPSSGAAYVFVRDGRGTDDPLDDLWLEHSKLVASDAHAGDQFGYSVAIYFDLIVVGAWKSAVGSNYGVGAAYVFRRNDGGTPFDPLDDTWTQHAKLTASDGITGDNFGSSVDVVSGLVVVGAYNVGWLDGAAYVYVLNVNGTPFDPNDDTWTQRAKLVPSSTSQYHLFGASVSASENYILVGAPYESPGSSGGAAYVFLRFCGLFPDNPLDDIWSQRAFLSPSDASDGLHFGMSVSIQNDWALIGAPGLTVSGYPAAGYLFKRNDNGTPPNLVDDTWTEAVKLTTGIRLGDMFGVSVALDDDYALVGANGSDTPEVANCGLAYCYKRNGATWAEHAILQSDGNTFGDGFGRTVGLSGSNAIVASWADDSHGLGAGAAHVFVIPQESRGDGSLPEPDELEIGPAGASCIPQIVSEPLTGGGRFGDSVAIQGGLAIVGVPGAEGESVYEGAAYVLTRIGSTWQQLVRLTGSAAEPKDYFGSSISMDGELVAIAARAGGWSSGRPNGKVYVFRQDGLNWVEEAILTDDHSDTGFGGAVSVSGNRVVVGVPYDDRGCQYVDEWCNTGAVQVFVRNEGTWTREATIATPAQGNAARHNYFGWSVAIDGDTLLVGAPLEGAFGAQTGAAYIYRRGTSGWQQEARLVASDGKAFDEFGAAVSISGDRAAIGAWCAQRGEARVGAVYVFQRNGSQWEQETKLVPSEGNSGNGFGQSVSMRGDRIVVGENGKTIGNSDARAVYVYGRTDSGWALESRLTPPSEPELEWYGASLATDGSSLIVGAPCRDGGADCGGSALFYSELDYCETTLPNDDNLGLGDSILFAYEGDALPFEEGSGMFSYPCDEACYESIEDGHLVLQWPVPLGDPGSGGYYRKQAIGPQSLPPNLWIEWRFRSNHPIGCCFTGCDATFSFIFKGIHDAVEMYGNYAGSIEGGDYVLGLALNEFHTYRFETDDGRRYRLSADGVVFKDSTYNGPAGYDYFQMHPRGGCTSDQIPDKENAWDYVRLGALGGGATVVGAIPPPGFLRQDEYGDLDNFTVTFEHANHVYVDEIDVSVSGGIIPSIIATRRPDNGPPEQLEIQLNQPIPPSERTTFAFPQLGAYANVVSYTYQHGDVNADGRWNLLDYGSLQRCLYVFATTNMCSAFDYDVSTFVTLEDYVSFHENFVTGGP